MFENLTWILEGILLVGLYHMFLADNTGLWIRPKSEGTSDDGWREMRTGK